MISYLVFFIIAFIAFIPLYFLYYFIRYLARGNFKINRKVDEIVLLMNKDQVFVRQIDKVYQKFGAGEKLLYFIMNSDVIRTELRKLHSISDINDAKLNEVLYQRLKKAMYDEHRSRI